MQEFLEGDFCCNIDVPDFKNANVNYFDNLSLININVRSLGRKFANLISLLHNLKVRFTFIVLTETWLIESIDVAYDLPNYKCMSLYRSKHGGGIKIYYADWLTADINSELTGIKVTHEALFINVKVPNLFGFVLGAIYRLPNGAIDHFTEYIENNVLCSIDRAILVGDFNIDLLKIANDNKISQFSQCMHTFGYSQYISRASYFSPIVMKPTSLLDHIWHNLNLQLSSYVIFPPFSDHMAVCIVFDKKIIRNNVMIKFRNFSIENKSKFLINLRQSLFSFNMHAQNVNIATNEIVELLSGVVKRSFPIKSKLLSEKRLNQPWLTSRVMTCINKKHNLFKLFRRGLIAYEVFKTYSALLKCLLKIAERRYRRQRLSGLRGNSRGMFKYVNELLGRKSTGITDRFVINGEIVKDKTKISGQFANYFESVPATVRQNIGDYNGEDLLSLIPNNASSFFFTPATADEVLKIISKLNKGSDVLSGLPLIAFKLGAPMLAPIISNLFNMCIQLGRYPDLLKLARVVPVFKTGNKSLLDNYRPISILSTLNKIFEKLIYKRMYSFIENNAILTNSQFGFRADSSTEKAALGLIMSILPAFLNKEFALTVFIDFKKAFDTIDHELLVKKLDRYGFRGISNEFFASYLNDRVQYVDYNGSHSDLTQCLVGVPQGSCLGPLLFILYINDLDNYLNNVDIIKYADDTTLTILSDDILNLTTNMNEVLARLSDWCKFNMLSLNAIKTKYMLFTTRTVDVLPRIIIEQSELECVDSYLYLGFHFEPKMKFILHYEYLFDKLSTLCGVTYRIGNYLNCSFARTFYFSFIYPILTYGIVLWGGSLGMQRGLRVQRLQNRIVKNLLGRFYEFNNVNDLFKHFKLLKIADVFKFKVTVCMYKLFFHNYFPSLLEYLLEPNIIHDHLTRQATVPRLPFPRIESLRHSFNYQFIDVWNSIPNNIKNSPSLSILKTQLMSYFLEQY